MEEKQDSIANVGIKQSQKEKISETICKDDKYKSINEFVQEAVSNQLLMEYKKQEPTNKKDEKKFIIDEINKINADLIKDELLGLHKLNSSIINKIQLVKSALSQYKMEFTFDRIGELLSVRRVKETLDSYIDLLIFCNRESKLGISEHSITELKKLRDRFVHYAIAQEVKG